MKGIIFWVFAIVMLSPAKGEEEEQMMDLEGQEQEEEYLECFRCDLGFWDACYTTETNCSQGELCYTGRGKAADSLDIKTLGCAKAVECNVETTVELFFNNNIFVMTKSCCDTPFCNSAQKIPIGTLFYLTLAVLTTRYTTKDLV
ncbi:sperm acrosome membrane-associated protein 4-like isoform X2 [Cyprinodon tularosa]|uniref:sperm acrosome membrane-associated protein 4-like isoform X2 n=1 Tax=Cyprinodon tularosa TaxID=77115 RepID=UPI0018E1F55F|nr:sperm acrosome membrane-associated protein 4-like isoform X2 [Cyprinodon tularosa]